MSLFSKARSFVRDKIDDLSDAIYGVMPSPIQNVVDSVGKPIAETANNFGQWTDEHVPDKVKDAATAVFGVPSVLAGGATALNTLRENISNGAIPALLSSAKEGIKQAFQTPAGEVVAPAFAGSAATPAGSAAATAAASAPSVASTLGQIGAAAVPAAIQAGSSIAGAIDYNQTMRDTNRETNQTNMAIANQNLAFQRELQEYNKNLQQTIFNREDTSYQRTVNDMRAAGLSPLAMNGTNGAGEAIALGALNNQYQHTPLSGYKSPLDSLAQINPIGFLSSLEDLRAKRLQNNLASETFDYNKARIKAESLLSQYSQMDASRREKFNSAFNLNSSMSEKEKMAQIISKLLGMPLLNKDGSPNMSLGDDLDKLLDRLSGSAPVKSAVNALSKIGSKKVAPAVNSSSSSSSVKEPLNGTYDKKTGKYYSTRYHAWMDKKYGR